MSHVRFGQSEKKPRFLNLPTGLLDQLPELVAHNLFEHEAVNLHDEIVAPKRSVGFYRSPRKSALPRS
jgi:hypothetical protein